MAMASSDSSSGANGDRDVFGSLPNTRPQRRSARRDRAGAKAKPAGRAGEARLAQARQATTPLQPGRSPPLARSPPAQRPKPAAAPRPAPAPSPPLRPSPRPRPPRLARPTQIPPAGYATPRGADDGVPHGAELVTTAVQAAGELAQIGLAAGGRALKSALGRLPRP